MISYHLNTSRDDKQYTYGWKTADVIDINRIARCASQFTWSPSIWADNKRCKENFIQAQFCVLDFDDGELTLEQAIKNFCDWTHIIGPTKSHRIKSEKNPTACDRFRVILLFEKPIIDPRLYKWNMSRIVSEHQSDRQCVNASRYFHPCREISSLSTEGYVQKIDMDVSEDFDKPFAYEYSPARIEAKRIPEWVYKKFERDFKPLNRNYAVLEFARALAPFSFAPEEILLKIKETKILEKYPIDLDPDNELLRTIRNGLKIRSVEDE